MTDDELREHLYEEGERVHYDNGQGQRTATIVDLDYKDGEPTYGLDDGYWTYEDDVVGLAGGRRAAPRG